MKRYRNDTYGFVLKVVVTTDFVAAMDKYKLRDRTWDPAKLDQDEDYAESRGIALSERPLGHVLWVLLKPKAPASVLAHEAVHLANYVWLSMGMDKASCLDDEPFTYLVEWIVERMTQ